MKSAFFRLVRGLEPPLLIRSRPHHRALGMPWDFMGRNGNFWDEGGISCAEAVFQTGYCKIIAASTAISSGMNLSAH